MDCIFSAALLRESLEVPSMAVTNNGTGSYENKRKQEKDLDEEVKVIINIEEYVCIWSSEAKILKCS